MKSLLLKNNRLMVSKEIFAHYGKQGIFKQAVPKSIGGLGTTYADLHNTFRHLGKTTSDPSLILSFQAHIWGGIFPLMKFGTALQQEQYLPGLLEGDIVAGHAITEANSGSNIHGIQGTFHEDGGVLILNGNKCYITNAPIADVILVYLKDEDQLSGVLLQKNDAGCQFVQGKAMSCFASSPIGEVKLFDCRVPTHRLVGMRYSGTQMVQSCLELERTFIFSGILGVMEWQLDQVKAYAKKRKVRDTPLTSYQVIQHKIVDMFFRIRILDNLISEAVNLKGQEKRITLQSALIKTYGSQAFLDNSNDAVHILGALGLEEDIQLSSLVHDALGTRILGGTIEIQKNIAASLIGI